MVSEVKVLVAFNRIFLIYTILVLFWACSPKKINRDDPVNQQIDLRYADGEVYNQKREILEKESLRLELEKTWILSAHKDIQCLSEYICGGKNSAKMMLQKNH